MFDELLNMSKRMQARLDELQRSQSEVVERLSRRVKEHNELLSAVSDVVRRPPVAQETELKAA